jgi:hypothetical protein
MNNEPMMTSTSDTGPRYPDLRVALRSPRPEALVSAVRFALRRAGVDHDEIDRFTGEALSQSDPRRTAALCAEWVILES